MSRIPHLGSRGEGWVALQVIFLVAIPIAASQASTTTTVETPLVSLGRQVGAIALLAALSLMTISIWFLRRAHALSALPKPLETATLVVTGPYRFIRHPIYSALILAGVAVALVRVSWVVAVLTVALAIVLDLKRRREEVWLGSQYPEYEAYRARTRALIPFVY